MYETICQQILNACQEVGNFIQYEYRHFDKSKIEYKGINDLVSYVDKTAEQKLVEHLAKILPEAGFITEENPENQLLTDKEFHWVVDPLDGTTNFLHQVPIFSISVGLMHYDKVVAGVVYAIEQGEFFYAWQGGGAFLNKQKIAVATHKQLKECLLATGFPIRDNSLLINYLTILKELIPQTHGLRRMGSAAIDLVYVACGRFDAYFEYNLKPWDLAAGSLIVQEAGGIVSNFNNENTYLFTGQTIAASASIHALVQPIIANLWQV